MIIEKTKNEIEKELSLLTRRVGMSFQYEILEFKINIFTYSFDLMSNVEIKRDYDAPLTSFKILDITLENKSSRKINIKMDNRFPEEFHNTREYTVEKLVDLIYYTQKLDKLSSFI